MNVSYVWWEAFQIEITLQHKWSHLLWFIGTKVDACASFRPSSLHFFHILSEPTAYISAEGGIALCHLPIDGKMAEPMILFRRLNARDGGLQVMISVSRLCCVSRDNSQLLQSLREGKVRE